jgi:hypothetical protein
VGHGLRRVRRTRYRRRRRIRRLGWLLATLALIALSARWIVASRHLHFSGSSYLSALRPNSPWDQWNPSVNLAVMAAQSAAVIAAGPRVVYPYSVVPGGVRSVEDLREASDHDPVVGEHYGGFDFRNARIIELQEPELVYLSYRLHNKVFWTKKKVRLRKGEKLITDGTITGRTRCANRVSPTAQLGISPEEPPAEKFEQPVNPGEGSSMQAPFPVESSIAGPVGPPPLLSSIWGPGGGFPPVFPPPIPCVPSATGVAASEGRSLRELAKTTPQPCSLKPTKPHKPPPPTIPEPATILLFSSGVAGIYLRYRKARSRR